MNKKKILKALGLVACAILLVVGSIAGTMAFMTDSKTVTNTFTVGKVAITMDEAKVDQYGVKDGDSRVTTGNTYKLIPNHTYVKDPTIHVAGGSERCYLFVKVVNGIKDIEADTNNIAAQLAANKWVALEGVENMYYYDEVVDARETASTEFKNVPVFAEFTVDSSVENDDLTAYDAATLVVTAYAIQADGFDTAAAAWTAASGAFTPAP